MPTKKEKRSFYMLEKGGFCLKTLAIIFYSSPCGFLHHFDSSQKKKKSKNGIKLPHAKVYDLREEETRSTRASKSHSWTGRDVMRSQSKSSSRVHQSLRKHCVILWVLWERTHREVIGEISGMGQRVSAV